MVKKELELLDGPPEFERYTAEVRFPSNINGDLQNKLMDKIRLKKNADLGNFDEDNISQTIDNPEELMEEIQNHLIGFALDYMEEVDSGDQVEKDQLTPEAYDVILSQYSDQIQGVKIGKN